MGKKVRTAGWLTLALVTAPAAAAPAIAQALSAPRPSVILKDGWRFSFGAPAAGPEVPSFDDRNWAPVTVPHSWNRVGYYLADATTRGSIIDKRQGLGWYRLHLRPPPNLRNKRIWLEFDAASRIASVWLNGTLLGEHRGGFSRFRFDATDAMRWDGDNVLAVRTDNSAPAPGSTTSDVLPLAGDFFVYGGIYRPVRLIGTDPVHFDMGDSGGPGVYATTALRANGSAQVRVKAIARNDSSQAATATIVTRLIDSNGQLIAQALAPATIGTSTAGIVESILDVPRPHLWQGVADPHLYRLAVELRSSGGALLDRVEQSYGIREMRLDPQRGFILNGKMLRLHGVGLHQEAGDKGWAANQEDVARDLAALRSMGINTLRLTHYQHGQAIHDLADRLGLVLWDEIPLVSKWTIGASKQPSRGLIDNARQQLTELIRQNSNHASVATWGIANEVDFGDSLPAFLGGSSGPPPDPIALLTELDSLAKTEDPSRPTALATCCEATPSRPGATIPVTATAVDTAGANRYYGWYYGRPEDLSGNLDALHARRADQPMAVTEYGAGGATSIHSDNPLGGPADARGRAQPEEYQSDFHERNWAVLARKPYLWATWLWNGFDFASTARREGDSIDINTKGLITADRKIRKDGFYFYRANWSAGPTVHINGRRYVDRAYAVTDVRVYSNAARTTLRVNGRLVGTRADCPLKVCVWKGVRLAIGANEIVAVGRFARTRTEDRVRWTLAPQTARAIRIDSGALVAGTSQAGRFGSDNFFEGGEAGSIVAASGPGQSAGTAKIGGTADNEIAATFRKGRFAYQLPLADGHYTLALTFVEPSAAPGERSFDVSANGTELLKSFDIAQAAGSPRVAMVRSFPVDVRGGKLDLAFTPVKGEAIVSAVEVVR